jgi:hypothetical protein
MYQKNVLVARQHEVTVREDGSIVIKPDALRNFEGTDRAKFVVPWSSYSGEAEIDITITTKGTPKEITWTGAGPSNEILAARQAAAAAGAK